MIRIRPSPLQNAAGSENCLASITQPQVKYAESTLGRGHGDAHRLQGELQANEHIKNRTYSKEN